MLAALGVVLLYLGSLVEVLDATVAVLASLLCVFAVIEYGKAAPWLVFAVTSVLAILLLPNKTPAIEYALFFGFYPILKEKYEKRRAPIAWVLKELTFNIALVAVFFALKFVVLGNAVIPMYFYVIGLVLLELVFVLYDLALTKLITYYLCSLRKRFKIK
ncbi:MAG: hypothetical protein E7653_06575 [Ruminococcaceae bacterium]|nr:hypothetical protein [Oscillospiraceae bacterium]